MDVNFDEVSSCSEITDNIASDSNNVTEYDESILRKSPINLPPDGINIIITLPLTDTPSSYVSVTGNVANNLHNTKEMSPELGDQQTGSVNDFDENLSLPFQKRISMSCPNGTEFLDEENLSKLHNNGHGYSSSPIIDDYSSQIVPNKPDSNFSTTARDTIVHQQCAYGASLRCSDACPEESVVSESRRSPGREHISVIAPAVSAGRTENVSFGKRSPGLARRLIPAAMDTRDVIPRSQGIRSPSLRSAQNNCTGVSTKRDVGGELSATEKQGIYCCICLYMFHCIIYPIANFFLDIYIIIYFKVKTHA